MFLYNLFNEGDPKARASIWGQQRMHAQLSWAAAIKRYGKADCVLVRYGPKLGGWILSETGLLALTGLYAYLDFKRMLNVFCS